MKTELDMVRSTSPSIEIKHPFAMAAARKRLNEAANSLVHGAVLKNDLPALSAGLATTMIATARTLVGLGLEPDLENFVYAAAELVGNTRKVMDDALRFGNLDDFKLASVMMEITLKGIASTLSLPLEELMKAELAKEVVE